MMDVTAINGNGELERYLLGLLPDDARDRIDERLLVDAQLFDALCVVENELAYDYALGLLTPDERRRFEERFLNRPAVQARVRTAAALLDGIGAAEAVRPARQWWLYAAAAASVLLVAWFARDNARLRQAASPVAQSAAAPTTQTASVPPPASEVPQTTDRPASIVAVVLQPGVVRSSGSPSRIRLRQGDIVRVELARPPSSARAPNYRASIRDADDVLAWEGTGIVSKDGQVVAITVPAASLPPNDYEVTLYGVRPGRSSEEIASYAFSTTGQ
jgi:hypothetical protein